MADGLAAAVERWPIAGGFTIARGTKTEAVVVLATVTRNGVSGRGECVPYARYGETVEGVVHALQAQAGAIANGAGRADLLQTMPAGAARNALDCALWSVAARAARQAVWTLAGLPKPQPVVTAYTLSLGEPAAQRAAGRPLLKVKLGGAGDDERILAVRQAAPEATLIVDANESWNEATLVANLAACARARVALIEQPLPAGADDALEGLNSPVPLCADESFHGLDGLDAVARRYNYANLKLDKTGGLTEAITVAQAVRERGMGLMVGCMLGTSLGMAPAFLLTPWAQFVDLDGPLLLSRDRVPGFEFKGSTMLPAGPAVWD
jgi:L-alanine-DL-glutamate epimerase-like enolase superfamily enzyme